jgi:hypothetical protein
MPRRYVEDVRIATTGIKLMWPWIRKLFGSADAIPAEVARLPATSERALSSSLNNLRSEERGWIALSEAIRLFSNEAPDYAFGEMDE